jgi:hypothetical protein
MGKKHFRGRWDVYVYMLSTTAQTTVPVPSTFARERTAIKKENKVSMVQAVLN